MTNSYYYIKFSICFVLLLIFHSIQAQSDKNKSELQKNRQGTPMTFEEASCAPKELEIVKFQDFSTKKARQIVVGRNIFYKGKPKSAINWDWELPDWPSFSGNRDSYDKGRITVDDLPVNNDYFEEDFVVEVSADIEGDGVLERASSTDEPDGWNFRVFFLKDDANFGVPNWFHYWKQVPAVVAALDIPGIKLFIEDECGFTEQVVPVTLCIEYNPAYVYNPEPTVSSTYGSNQFGLGSLDTKQAHLFCGWPYNDGNEHHVGTAYNELRCIRIGEGCGFQKAVKGNLIEGIHTFYSTVIHEREHAIIECEVWEDGYDSFLDLDGDGYNDEWETDVASPRWGFKLMQNDSYESGYDSNLLGTGVYRAGTEFEENRCRNEEAAANLNIVDPYDWSFDPKTISPIQGKQW